MKTLHFPLRVMLISFLALHGAPLLLAGPASSPVPIVVKACRVAVTPPLKEIAAKQAAPVVRSMGDVTPPRAIPVGLLPRVARKMAAKISVAGSINQGIKPASSMPSPLMTFEGVSNLDSVYPSDCNGDVGLSQYVEMVNMHMAVYDKVTGANVVAPFLMSTLYAAAGFPAPASTTDNGDPVVLYDHLANRWIISQFIVSVTPCHEVIGVSQTSDATGAWYLYDFVMPGTDMNDYPKLGVWPDAYYMTDNQFTGGVTWHGAGVFAFERAKMLAGDPSASYQYFDLSGANLNFGGLLPADLDGQSPPVGAPEYFAMMDDGSITPGVCAVYLWKFHVDWTTPANSTFGVGLMPNVTNVVSAFNATFTSGSAAVPQPGTSQKLDTLSDRLMHRLQYRNFGSYESLITCHSVNAGVGGVDQAGVRYYQFRRALPSGDFTVAEQATHAPDGASRWMGSAAMDGQGNLAVGYSVSSTNIYPSIYYAGRMAGDPAGGLYQGETLLFAGSGSQTGTAGRWGDYSALVVDPVDDCTFYYVNEYLPATSAVGWHTRIGSFQMASPHMGVVRGVVTNTQNGATIAGATVFATNGLGTITDMSGSYLRSYPTGTWQIVACAADFSTSSVATVVISEGVTNILDFGLTPIPMRVSPSSGLVAVGQQGGPFSPDSQSYVMTNASASALTWTGVVSQSWVALNPVGGVLAAGGWTGITATLVRSVELFPTGAYQASIEFSNTVDGETATRLVNLTVTPYLPPAIASYDFSSGLPAGWSVLTNGMQGTNLSWAFNDPGNRGNLTGGSGGFAIADNDHAGPAATNMNTEMRTVPFNLANYSQCFVGFKSDFYNYLNEIADVDVSRNGNAGPWSNVWHQAGVSARGPASVLIDISAIAAGASNAMIRFHYNDNGYFGWWWEVDDIVVYAGGGSSGNLGLTPPQGLAASGFFGGPFVPDRLYRMTNSTASPLIWTSTWSSAWMDVEPKGGVLDAGAITNVSVAVTAIANGLTPGFYQDQVTFSNITEGLSQQRDITLTIMDTLTVTPQTGLVSSGLEGGPFTPSNVVYTLVNSNAAASLSWTISHAQSWLTALPSSGIIAAGSSQIITASLNAASLMVPGAYVDSLAFSNVSSGVCYARTAAVTVVAITGKIAVYDSVSPTNDLQIPFGAVGLGATRSEVITVRNMGPVRNLTVSNIVFGLYFTDFNDGFAQNWSPDVTGNWSVVSGYYRARSVSQDFMTSLYTGRSWAASSIQADLSRTGNVDNAQGVILRASPDFDLSVSGTGYAFLLGGDNYSVWWVSNNAVTAIQGWTMSPAIDAGGLNSITANASGTQMWLRVNGVLIWQGADSHFASGYNGVCGYTTPTAATTGYFDNVFIDQPHAPGSQPAPDQLYLNGNPQPDSSIMGPHDYGESHDPKSPGGDSGDEGEGEGLDASPIALHSIAGFAVTNLPSMPLTLSPGASFVFTVTYSPSQIGTNATSISIESNDNDTPSVSISVNGHAAAGVITGSVVSAGTGAPLSNATVTVLSGIVATTNTVSDSAGGYSVAVPTGTFSVVAGMTAYVVITNTGITVASDGAAASCNFSLVDSSLSCSPSADVAAAGPPGGPFTPSAFVYTLTNSALSAVSWNVSSSAAWLTVAPSGGSLAGHSFTTVTASLAAATASLIPAKYDGMLTFTNLSDSVWQQRHVMLTVARDYFTELFTNGSNDLHYMSLTFVPGTSSNYYSVARTANVSNFPTDPTGGPALPLTDDSFVKVVLSNGATVSLYGVATNTFFVGSNGYLTFGTNDTAYAESLAAHFSKARIAGLFRDLNPSSGGSISYKQLGDRAAITFQNVPEYAPINTNSFQFELFFNGMIRLTWLRVDAGEGLAGLSRGTGIPSDFVMSDLSAYPTSPLSISVQVNATAGAYGGISPSGTVAVLYGGATNFQMAASTYYHIGSVLTNGSAIGYPFAGSPTNGYVFWWSNLTANGTIVSQFAENLATNSTPIWWLAQYGLTNGGYDASAMGDFDGDGMTTWQEYLAGTDPTNRASCFKIRAISLGAGITLTLQDVSSNRLYDLYSSTNLHSYAWRTVSSNLVVTNSTVITAPTPAPPAAAFRIGVHLP